MAHQSFPERAVVWRLRTRTLELPRRPLLMGIINVTPDSFSDGGHYLDPAAAVEQARKLVAEGADLLDIGGESTRPGAEPVHEDEEIGRALPVIRALVNEVEVPLSVDTRKARVAAAAIEAGVEIVNDVGGFSDARMIKMAAESGAGVCVMHMQGTPDSMQQNPTYGDVVAEVVGFLGERRDALVAGGVEQEKICLDPGIGFGKTYDHNLSLLRNCHALHALGCPVLVGYSRKRFLGTIIGDENADRTAAGVGVAIALAGQGVQILRVHDVRPVREALLAFELAGQIGVESPRVV